ncbi:glycoside hydrolase, clan GH-D [Candidatus Koribacter versatilis Ellin345]|uniref:Glycoside hydrolase, clan GH-D n=1 Tax=Koribacter versatilis (strain Ellin345) TaxID=204669 RepID=Q1ITY1_KORVE|nr:glycoside hydrolase family 36 protein [Candidatus Koribacter versatilis]ABF39669.1 glycoside hydrolase, clan GH-D [Candidatus Koribacter versatilis Ellin345]
MKLTSMHRCLPLRGNPRRKALFTALLMGVFAAGASGQTKIEGKQIAIEFDAQMHSRAVAFGETPFGDFSSSESVVVDGKTLSDFAQTSQRTEGVSDMLGAGKRLIIEGKSGDVFKTVTVSVYDDFPNAAVFDVSYKNAASSSIEISKWTNNAYSVTGSSLWSFEPGTYERRPAWVAPLKVGFHQKNYLGMNASDYGGGTPFADIWSRKAGLAIGDLELKPKQVSLPVAMPDAKHATLSIEFVNTQKLAPGESLTTFRTFAIVHHGDYFAALLTYKKLMQKLGQPASQRAADGGFRPMWCAWGYGRRFTVAQIEKTIPEAKRIGFEWVTVDDGWQTKYGDLTLDPKKFPRGDADMKALVDKIHAAGMKAQLWWSPMSAAPDSALLKDDPDLELKNKDGSPQKISWWNSLYLCPAYEPAVEVQRKFVQKIIGEWGFDGLKLDGQYMNAVPACYNPAHHHAKPEDSVEQLPLLFKAIYDEAQKEKPGALIEFCPCGTSYSFYTMPYYNMSVASDPSSSWQVRTKGKTIKALLGDGVPYFGDHVELSDNASDFASTVGVGGVVGSQFTLPAVASRHTQFDLVPARRKIFEKWVGLYKEKMLSEGTYEGTLYDIGFDRPEAHAIKKGSAMYYAFYAPTFSGKVELRGLEDRDYKVTDYENNKVLGPVHGPTAQLETSFSKHLMLEADPQ